jgi:hypothetical protein
MNRPRAAVWIGAGLANLIVVAPLLWAAAVQARSVTTYAASVQEDGILEWTTVWGFVVATLFFALAAWRERRAGRLLPWFSVGLALFCLLVALEEISWGQRLIGYRPPAYFLEHNFQQELNVHNLVDTSLRKLSLKAIIIGYGVTLPLLALISPAKRLLAKFGIWVPPLSLAPGFVAAAVAYETYPWKYTGELVELMLGLAFAFAALAGWSLTGDAHPRSVLPAWRPLLVATVVIVALGGLSGALSARARLGHPGNLEAAAAEARALRGDLEDLIGSNAGKPRSKCGLHRRVYTWVTRSDVDEMYEGRFAALKIQGLPEERADYFLDPWNSPYWIRHRCSSDGQRISVYSFGPNRRRDSDAREIRGDDIGEVVKIEPEPTSAN